MSAKRIEVVAYDPMNSLPGHVAVLHTWKTAHHHGKRKAAKLARRADKFMRRLLTQDRSAEHIIYTRSV